MSSYIIPLNDLKNYITDDLYKHILSVIINFDGFYVDEKSAGVWRYMFVSNSILLSKTIGKEIIFVLDKIFLIFSQKFLLQEDKSIKVFSSVKIEYKNVEEYENLILFISNLKFVINKNTLKVIDL